MCVCVCVCVYVWNLYCERVWTSNVMELHASVFSGDSDGKESTCNAGDTNSISGSRRSPGGGNSYSLLYSCLENSMDWNGDTFASYSPWGCKESDITVWLILHAQWRLVSLCHEKHWGSDKAWISSAGIWRLWKFLKKENDSTSFNGVRGKS